MEHKIYPAIMLPNIEQLREVHTDRIENLVQNCFQVLKERDLLFPNIKTNDLQIFDSVDHIITYADDDDLEDIYYLIEDELYCRGLLDGDNSEHSTNL